MIKGAYLLVASVQIGQLNRLLVIATFQARKTLVRRQQMRVRSNIAVQVTSSTNVPPVLSLAAAIVVAGVSGDHY